MKKLKSFLAVFNTCVSFALLGYSLYNMVNYIAYRSYYDSTLKESGMSAERISEYVKGTPFEWSFVEVLGIIFAILIIGFGVFSLITLRKKLQEEDSKSTLNIISNIGQILSCVFIAIVAFGYVATTSALFSESSYSSSSDKYRSYAFLFPLNTVNMSNAQSKTASDVFSWIIVMFGSIAIVCALLAGAELALSFAKPKEGAAAGASIFDKPSVTPSAPAQLAAPAELAAPAAPAAPEPVAPVEPVAPEPVAPAAPAPQPDVDTVPPAEPPADGPAPMM